MTVARISLVISFGMLLQARTLVVGPGGPFADVREAIRAASANDTVQVRGGTYQGNLVLDKQVGLEGIGWPVLRGEAKEAL